MLAAGIVLLGLGSVAGGWCSMCDALPAPARPRLGRGPVPLVVAILLSIAGIVALFFVKWYAGLIGIVAAIVAFNAMAAIWHLT